MEQNASIDRLVGQRIRALRLAQGWSLDTLAERAHLSPSNLSRIETGSRRIALDQLVALARVLETSVDQLIESPPEEDVVIRPHQDDQRGVTTWTLTPARSPGGLSVAKMCVTAPVPPLEQAGVHAGRDRFTVLSGTAALRLGERVILVPQGSAAEFSTMVPHAFGAHGGQPVEILTILTAEGHHAHEIG